MKRYKLVKWNGETVARDLRNDQAVRRQYYLMQSYIFTTVQPDDETKYVPVEVTGSDSDFTMRIERKHADKIQEMEKQMLSPGNVESN